MDLKEIQNLIKFVAKSGASEVKLEMEDVKITIKTGSEEKETTIIQQMPSVAPVAQPAPVAAVATIENEAPVATTPAADEDSKFITVKSPIIGTFYRKPSPDKPNFSEVANRS